MSCQRSLDPLEASPPSKSRIKRELAALQALARELATLPRGELTGLGFGEATRAAIDETARISDRRALARHHKRIAKCLAREDTAPLERLLAAREAKARVAAARHHRVEGWRARLLAEGDGALTEFFEAYPAAERQRLRQLVRSARRDVERGRTETPRRLFRQLREIVAGAEGDG
jgi:ribosome-associated protein